MITRILCIHSSSICYDPRSYLGGRYPEFVRWTALLNATGWKTINKGENGRSIPKLDQEIKMAVQSVCGAETDILTVMLGSNDLLQCLGLSAEICATRMERFLAALLAKAHADLKILLVAPPPMEAGPWVSDHRTLLESLRLAGYYEMVAHQLGIAFADAGAWGVGLAYDGVHFSEESHIAFAKGIRTALDTLL